MFLHKLVSNAERARQRGVGFALVLSYDFLARTGDDYDSTH